MAKLNSLHRVSIVIPVFNETNTIADIIRLTAASNTLGLEKEIIIVDDGSTDGTHKVLKALSIPFLRVYHLPHNQGKGAAVREGIKRATGDIVLIQDADREYTPDDYPLLLGPIVRGDVAVVYGSRSLNKDNQYASRFNRFGNDIVTTMTNVLYGSCLTDVSTCYKVFRRDVLADLPLRCVRFEFCTEATAHVLKRGIKIHEVPIRYQPRTQKEGKKIRVHDGLEALWTLTRVKLGR